MGMAMVLPAFGKTGLLVVGPAVAEPVGGGLSSALLLVVAPCLPA